LPKIDRFNIGKKIAEENLEVYILIFKASRLNKKDIRKVKFIIEANEKIDLVRFLIRNCFDMNIIKLKQYRNLSKHLLEIGKMCGGWIKFLQSNKG